MSLESDSTVYTYVPLETTVVGVSNAEEGRNGVPFSLRGCSPSGNAGRQTERISHLLQGTVTQPVYNSVRLANRDHDTVNKCQGTI